MRPIERNKATTDRINQVLHFKGCSSLEKVSFSSDNLISIENCAFKECTCLKEFIILPSITSIGSFMFAGCSKDLHIEIPPSVTQFGESAFPTTRNDVPQEVNQSRYGSCSFDPQKDETTNNSKCEIF